MPGHTSNLLNTDQSVLVIVDVQTKLTTAMPARKAEQMLANIVKLTEAADLLQVPILVTEQYPNGLGATEARISEKLPAHTPIFEKTVFSCCTAKGFLPTLTNLKRKQIILVGQETHVCVLQTALELTHLGYQVHVVADAVCSRNAGHRMTALLRMQQQGVTLSNYESVLFEWLRDAAHPAFKTISKWVR